MRPQLDCEWHDAETWCTRRAAYLRHYRIDGVPGLPLCVDHAARYEPPVRAASVRPLVLFTVGSEGHVALDAAFDELARLAVGSRR